MVLVFYKFYWVESGVHRLSCHGIAWAQCEDKRWNIGPWDLRKKECRQWGHWRWAQDWSNPCVSLPVAGGEWPDHSLPIPGSLVTSQPLGPTPDPLISLSKEWRPRAPCFSGSASSSDDDPSLQMISSQFLWPPPGYANILKYIWGSHQHVLRGQPPMRPVMLIHLFHRLGNWPTLRPASSWLISLGLNSTQSPVSQSVSLVTQCPTLCDPKNRSTPGLPVHHQSPNCLKPVLQTCTSQTNPQVGKLS